MVGKPRESALIIRTIVTSPGAPTSHLEETGETLVTTEVVTTVAVVLTTTRNTIASNLTTEGTGCTMVIRTLAEATTTDHRDRVSTKASERSVLLADPLSPQVMVDQGRGLLKSSSTIDSKDVSCQSDQVKESNPRSE